MRTAQCNTNEVQHPYVSPRSHGVQRYGSGQASIRVRHVYELLGYGEIACSGLDGCLLLVPGLVMQLGWLSIL